MGEPVKIPGLTSFPEMPVKPEQLFTQSTNFIVLCVSIIYLPAFLLQYVPVNKISN